MTTIPHLSIRLNSSLKLSARTPTRTNLTHPQSDSFIKNFPKDVFYFLSGLNSQNACGPDGVPPIILKTVPPC